MRNFLSQVLKLINNSPSKNQENQKREGGS